MRDQPDPAGEAQFVVGPPQPVTDSRQLPAVDSDGESGFVVSGANLGSEHPDNIELDQAQLADDPLGVSAGDVAEPPPDDVRPTDDELAADVADVDTDAVDAVGFDASDVVDDLLGATARPLPAEGGS